MKFASVRLPSKLGLGRARPVTAEPSPAEPPSAELNGAEPPPTEPPPQAEPKPAGTAPVEVLPAEPTPWATGLTAGAMVAALAMAADLLVSQALRGAYGWLWIPANLMLAVGIGPALWLMRKTPFWRWISYGVVVGFGLAWIGLAVSVVFRVRNGG
jgi:hypothetical protein